MARYLILNKKKSIRFFHDVCDDYDGKRERRRSFCLQQGHAMVVPYRLYKNTKSAMALKNILEVDAKDALDYLKDCDVPQEQVDKEIMPEDRIVKSPIHIKQPEVEPYEAPAMVSEEVKKTAAPRKARRTRKSTISVE